MKTFEEKWTAWLDRELSEKDRIEFEASLPDKAAAEEEKRPALSTEHFVKNGTQCSPGQCGIFQPSVTANGSHRREHGRGRRESASHPLPGGPLRGSFGPEQLPWLSFLSVLFLLCRKKICGSNRNTCLKS